MHHVAGLDRYHDQPPARQALGSFSVTSSDPSAPDQLKVERLLLGPESPVVSTPAPAHVPVGPVDPHLPVAPCHHVGVALPHEPARGVGDLDPCDGRAGHDHTMWKCTMVSRSRKHHSPLALYHQSVHRIPACSWHHCSCWNSLLHGWRSPGSTSIRQQCGQLSRAICLSLPGLVT